MVRNEVRTMAARMPGEAMAFPDAGAMRALPVGALPAAAD